MSTGCTARESGSIPFLTLGMFKIKKYILTVRTYKVSLHMNLLLWGHHRAVCFFFPLNLRLSLPLGRPDDLVSSLSATILCEIRKWSQPCQETCQSFLIMEEGKLKKHSINIKQALLMS